MQLLPDQGRYMEALVWPIEVKLHRRFAVIDPDLEATRNRDDQLLVSSQRVLPPPRFFGNIINIEEALWLKREVRFAIKHR